MTALVPEEGFEQIDGSLLIYRRESGAWIAFGDDNGGARIVASFQEAKTNLLKNLIAFIFPDGGDVIG